jgi:hypothetical protein
MRTAGFVMRDSGYGKGDARFLIRDAKIQGFRITANNA